MIVELRIFELREIECRGVLHEPDAGPIAEQVAELALDETRRASKQFTNDNDRHFDRDEAADRAPRCATALRGDDAVDDELPDPQRRDRYECADEAQDGHRDREAAMRAPDEPQQLRDVAQRIQALAK